MPEDTSNIGITEEEIIIFSTSAWGHVKYRNNGGGNNNLSTCALGYDT